MSNIMHYGSRIGAGVGAGALVATLFQNAQVWQSPHGGVIACLFASHVPANPLHIQAGMSFAFSATVPENYVLLGTLVPGLCSFQVLLISSIALGVLVGALYAYCSRPKQNEKIS